MIGLIDCNNFFVSCERVVNPSLATRPVVVLSSNDGCAVAMSNEAKALGITRSMPFFKFRHLVEPNNIAVLSGDHRLYGDISARVMATINAVLDEVEVYSIDEAFAIIPPYVGDTAEFGRYLVDTIKHDTGIPVSLGIAPTKTLAKIAARFAKKFSAYHGACVIDSDYKREKALSLTDASDVWGIGRKTAKRLADRGIVTAAALARLPLDKIERLLGVNGERTWRELNGEPCIVRETVPPERQSMTVSRSFASDLTDIEQLREAISSFTDSLARRLRRHRLYASVVTVFVATNRFHSYCPQYYGCETIHLDEATDDTLRLTHLALGLLSKVFRQGYGYKKAGVTVTRLVGQDGRQTSLFSDPDDLRRRSRLMEVLDRLNSSPDAPQLVKLASTGQGLDDKTRHEHR